MSEFRRVRGVKVDDRYDIGYAGQRMCENLAVRYHDSNFSPCTLTSA